ncbi:MAG TPA: pullulanase-type alpha-1,6-glucosidase, partial [Anaerolineae bacterium]
MNLSRRRSWPYLLAYLLALLAITTAAVSAGPLTQTEDEASIPPPASVTIAGTLQPQLGCPGEWNTECEESMLAYSPEDDLYIATFDLPGGNYEYKAALNGSWDDNYGLNAEYYGPNIPLEVPQDGPVTFFYDHKTRWVSDNVNSIIANVPGSFQDEIGCPGEWAPDCLRSLLQDPDDDGIYTFVTALIPAGDYEAKVAINQSWDENYGADGVADGPNIPFTVPENAQVTFTYDPETHLLATETADAPPGASTSLDQMPAAPATSAIQPAVPMPDLVVIPGTIQSVLGCAGDWMPACEATALVFDEEDQLWYAGFDLPAGDYEYKVALNGTWDVNFGLNAERDGPNIPLSLAEDTTVTFFFDHVTGWVTDDVNSIIANVPGSFQDEIGCPGEWAPDCLRSWLQDPDGDGLYVFRTTSIPAGDYEAKVAIGESWDENYGEGGAPDGPNIAFNIPADDTLMNFVYDSRSNVLTISAGAAGGVAGNINEQRAQWITADTIAWDVTIGPGYSYTLHYDPAGRPFSLGPDGIADSEAIPLSHDEAGLDDDILARFPHLSTYVAFTISPDDLGKVRVALKGQTAVTARDDTGALIDAAGLQIPGVLDDLYTYNGPLGVTYKDGVPTLRLWAPTARLVGLHLFDDADPETRGHTHTMRVDPDTGVWSITGEPEWDRKYYLYEVQVFVPAEGQVVDNLVTDPYSFSLSRNSEHSQIVNLVDPDLMPEDWAGLEKPPLDAPEDIVVYELHVRDFSVNDPAVPEDHRGTYLAFTHADSNGMQHLINLAQAGLTHLHLLPTFDIATIDEDKSTWVSPDFAELTALPPDSPEQQALINETRDQDGYNWGYDPYHYTTPEGSYSTDPNGPTRILEYRQMVQTLNQNGLRVVADVVYNHTNASGQSERSVLDRIVPGYYHRLNARGRVERSTCCENTATEHNMMRKLMIDSVLTWATAYKIDAFRFDLMGHHMLVDMLAIRQALDSLTLAEDGVDGSKIYVYGEGWNFGEVADNARGVNATQLNIAGTGIGTFNDRLRDAVRGGTPFSGLQEQGFVNGLYYAPNATDQGAEAAQLAQLLHLSDLIRIGLAGNLTNYEFTNTQGDRVPGLQIDYNGAPAGYTLDPQENVVYVSKHDNETLFDIIQLKAPLDSTMAERVRMQNMGLSIVALSQGVPFFHAGSDMLRSKSMDRDSFNSGDWFNKLDFTYETNNWGIGLPIADKNQDNWPVMAPLLAMDSLAPTRDDIVQSVAHFREMLQIRRSSPLFRLQTAAAIQERLAFHNTGPEQVPGLIVMSLSDTVG